MPTLRTIPRRTQRATIASVAAPVGGWNARDGLGSMDPLDAVTLQNWWPGTNSVQLRKGYTRHATGLPTQVETLMAYSSGTANTLFAITSNGNVYNVTSAGAVGAAAVTGLTNGRAQYVNFTTTANSYLVFINSADKQRVWTGSAWAADGDGAPYDVTGFDTATASNLTVFKSRIWYVQEESLRAWYLPINAIGGAATSLDLRGVFMKGGKLIACMNWTLDAGYGEDDHLCFITNRGEIAIYRLTDPTTPSGIALIGIFSVGSPVGDRPYVKYGGDLLIITRDGVIPMSKAIISDRTNPPISITDKIQYAVSSAVDTYGSNFGWQLLNVPKFNQLYLNVPINAGSAQQQYVQNNITKAWCNFTAWEANCWELFNDEPYFGGNTYVGLAWDGTSDNAADIEALAIQSFQPYGNASQKQCKMVRYHLLTDGAPAIFGNVNVDYDKSDRSAELSTSDPGFGLWDTGLWDTALWGSAVVPSADWQGATGLGYVFAPFLKVAVQEITVEWTATDLVLEPGGAL